MTSSAIPGGKDGSGPVGVYGALVAALTTAVRRGSGHGAEAAFGPWMLVIGRCRRPTVSTFGSARFGIEALGDLEAAKWSSDRLKTSLGGQPTSELSFLRRDARAQSNRTDTLNPCLILPCVDVAATQTPSPQKHYRGCGYDMWSDKQTPPNLAVVPVRSARADADRIFGTRGLAQLVGVVTHKERAVVIDSPKRL